jgi:hypothetical protein
VRAYVRIMFAALLALLVAGCGQSLNVDGIVLGAHNRPIGGAEIDAIPRGHSYRSRFHGESRADGCFSLGGSVSLWRILVPLRVVAPGYKPVTADVRSPSSTHVVVTLAPKNSAAESQVLLLPEDSKLACFSP